MRRVLAVLVVGIAVATAGCGGGSTGSPTPASPGAGTTPSTPGGDTPAGFAYPPGVTERGVADVDALLSAHRSGLSGRSVRVAIRYDVSTNGSGERVNFSGAVDPAADRAVLHVDLAGGSADYYAEGNDTYARQVAGTETRYRTGVDVAGLTERRLGSDRFVESALRTANFTPSGTVTRDGTTLLELTATDVDRQLAGGRNGTRTVEGRLLVDGDGVVRHAVVRATVETDAGGRYEYGVEVHLTDVGTASVERPDWLDEARDGG